MLVFISLFFTLSCSKKEIELPVINPTNLLKDELKLTDFADEVTYLQLDNSIMLPDIKDIKKTESGYLIITLDQLFCFGNNGKFKNKIGDNGNGPQEYSRIYDFTFDPDTKLIYLLDYKKVHVLTFEGEYKYSFKTPEELSFIRIQYFNHQLIFPKGFSFDGLSNEWYATDLNGKVLFKKNNSISTTNISVDYNINPVFNCNNNIYYWNQLNDTIFSIGEKVEPTYIFSGGKFRINNNDLSTEDNFREKDSWMLISVLGTDKFLIFDYILMKERKEIYVFYDKENQRMHEWAVLEKNKLKGENAFDSGPRFIPKSYFEIKGEEYLLSWINAFELKAHVVSDAFKNSTPKYPEKKKQLEQLANSLDENDNPVLMLVKLKN